MRTIKNLRRSTLVILAFILIASAVLDVLVALRASTTTDEPHHMEYGAHVLRRHPDHRYDGFFDSQMPISALNAVFLDLSYHLARHPSLQSTAEFLSSVTVGRMITILATLLLTVVIFLWSYQLYGETAAIAAALLCMLSPNLVANGTLTTTDLYHALGFMAAMYFFRQYLVEPTTRHAIACALVLALAQLTKTFALALYLVVIVIAAVAVMRPATRARFTPKRLVVLAVACLVSFIVVLNVAYSFDRTFMSFGSYSFETKLFSRLQDVSIASRIPVPVPYPYLQGMDMTKRSEETGRTFGDIYLLGEVRDPRARGFHPFASYYIVSWFFKVPIGLQILSVWGMVWIFRHRKLEEVLYGEGLLLFASGVLVTWLSLFSAAQIGIRHVLPALAAEIVIASAAFANFQEKTWQVKAVLCLLVVWIAASVARYYPQMIPYMNEWEHDQRYAWRVFADSNLDWGQDKEVVDAFLQKNPDVRLDPSIALPGKVLVRANRLTGVYRWDTGCVFLSKYKPLAQVGYAHFLFIVPPTTTATGTRAHP